MNNKILKNWPRCLSGFLVIFTFIIPVVIQAAILENPLIGVDNIGDLLVRVINFALSGLALFGLFMIIYAGFLFLIAGGNEETIKKAKATLVWAVIGVALILLSRVILHFVVIALVVGPPPPDPGLPPIPSSLECGTSGQCTPGAASWPAAEQQAKGCWQSGLCPSSAARNPNDMCCNQ